MQTIVNNWCSLADLDPFQNHALAMRNALVEANGTAAHADCGFVYPLQAQLAQCDLEAVEGTCDECGEHASLRFVDDDLRCGNFCFTCVR